MLRKKKQPYRSARGDLARERGNMEREMRQQNRDIERALASSLRKSVQVIHKARKDRT